MNTEEFRKHGKDMIDYICNYFDNIEQRNVAPSVEPGYLKYLIPNEAPQDGEKFDKIIQDVEDKIMPGILHWNHPNFFGYYPAGRSFPSMLGDMLSSCIGAFGFSWSSNPAFTELESIVLNWYARALSLPKAFLNDLPGGCGGGLLQSSTSECIFICMMAARNRVIQQLKGDNTERHDGEFLPQLVAYTSKDAHSSIKKAAKMTLVKIRIIDTDGHGRIDVQLLRQAIQNDLNAGLKPFFVAATAGTTSACAFDDFTEIGKICNETPNIWFHIDGAYGGNSFILPEMRQFSRGLEYADSLNVNPYKLLLVNLDASAMWVKDVMAVNAALNVDPTYLNHGCKEEFEFCERDFALGRRFRALKLWFVFRTYGISGLQTHIRNHMTLAKKFESFVQSNAEFEICNDVHLGLVCFRLKADDALNQKLLNQINASGKIHLTPSIVNGKYTLRFCLNYQFATYQHIVNAWKYIKTFANDMLRREHMEWLEEAPSILEDLVENNEEYIKDERDSKHIADSPSEREPKLIVDSYTTMQSFFHDH